jgi:hypothetical protein
MTMIHFPTTRFAELAARGGGITRTAAVDGALKGIESSRAESDGIIAKSIAAIEAIVYAPHVRDSLSGDEMRDLLRHADQIVTLAGMFNYGQLDAAARSLCDLTDGLLIAGVFEVAPVSVHVRALRLMAPGAAALEPDEAGRIFTGLQKVLAHFQISSLSNAGDCQVAGDANSGVV